MSLNPVMAMLGRRLRLALVGVGTGSFIGAMHRQASRLDNRYEVVSAVLSSDPARSRTAGRELGLDEDRIHTDVVEMFAAEAARDDGAEVADRCFLPTCTSPGRARSRQRASSNFTRQMG